MSEPPITIPDDEIDTIAEALREEISDKIFAWLSKQNGELIDPKLLIKQALMASCAALWQPIETAPKDGREVDLWCDGKRVTNARFGEEIYHKNGCWFRRNGTHIYDFDIFDNPTHWMPIPDAPTE